MVISQRLFATRFESYLFPVRDFSLYVETLPVETPPKKCQKRLKPWWSELNCLDKNISPNVRSPIVPNRFTRQWNNIAII